MSLITAAICEDEPTVLEYLCRMLKSCLETDGNQYVFDRYTEGAKLLQAISQGRQYTLVFLDIEMPSINGIDVCRKIRATNKDCLVTFISNKEEMVFQTFEVQPFRFIRKNHFNDEVVELVRGIHNALRKKQGTIITIHEEHSSAVYNFNVNELIYVEVVGKYCSFVTRGKTTAVRYKLADLAEQLTPYGFLQPHRSYLVNYRYVFRIETTQLILDDQSVIPMSRKRTEEIRTQFLQYTREEL